MSNLSNLPTLTVVYHGEPEMRCTRRSHDPPLAEEEGPAEGAQTLMLDLSINELNSENHRILIVSSPFQRCLESAVIIAQNMGVPAIQVHYGITERVSQLRDRGWDWEVDRLYVSEPEMRQIVAQMSRKGERRGRCRVSVEEFVGKKMSNEDINEAPDMAVDRIGTSLEEIRNSIMLPGDHAIAVGHYDSLEAVVERFGPKGIEILSAQHNSFVTIKTMSQNCYWVAGRSKVKIAGENN